MSYNSVSVLASQGSRIGPGNFADVLQIVYNQLVAS